MRGEDERIAGLLYVEDRGLAEHPLRAIRALANEALAGLSGEFQRLYSYIGRPGIAPERLLRALLLQAFYSIRSQRRLMEELEYNLLYRWFVDLGIDEPVWDAPRSARSGTGCSRARWRRASWPRFWLCHG